MKRIPWILPLLLAVVLPLVLYACGGEEADSTASPTSPTQSSEAGSEEPQATATPGEQTVEGLLQEGATEAAHGNMEAAIAAFDKAIEMDPQMGLAYNNRGLAHFQVGELEKALDDLNKAVELDPEEAIPYGNRGLIKHGLGKKDEAIADFEKFISLSNDEEVNEQVRQLIDEIKKQ